MPKAIEPPTTPASDNATPAPAFDVVAWIKGVLARPNPFGVADGPALPHPDGKLLELAEQSLELEEERRLIYRAGTRASDFDVIRLREVETKLKNLLGRARKIHATTPAGVYCKVLLVRRSKTGAALLAQSLAEDLIDSPGLRRLLWPAELV